MNKVALVYTFPLDSKVFIPSAVRWAETYHKFDPDYSHDTYVCFCNGVVHKEHHAIMNGTPYETIKFMGRGWDLGAYQHCSSHLTEYDLVVFTNARTHFHKAGWLKRLMEAREQNFDPNGLYGMSASYQPSYQKCPWNGATKFGGGHIRTCAFATNPNTFNRYPYLIDSREKGFLCESGAWNLSNWYQDNGYPVLMATWDGIYERKDWRKPTNVFRKGDQSNMLVWDRHTEIYRTANPQEKIKLQRLADGV